ncbi:cardiolipin synthase [Solilutibacter silvestris]|uniref:Cardiolipin synthase n=1 Tax=Solilutibacter silvestris TaxID=1645665 RepID=A0A2K1Q160_9GAMM|nr:cardiolipin synthase [Lysobacter silvestris]PNS08770.1 cardiolipin synthase [Lysobacter silvestris]
MWDAIHHAWTALLATPHIRAWLGFGWACYVVVLGVYIILQKREPAATLSWLFSLALLPYLGFVVYYLLGPQKISRQRLRRPRAYNKMYPDGADTSGDGEDALLHRLAMATTGYRAVTAHDVRLLVDGSATYAALIDDIRKAQSHIHLEYYIFQPDHSGTALHDALLERARAGVKVRLLLDAVGSSRMPPHFFRELIAAGGELAWFHSLRFRQLWKFWKRPWINLRTHRKIVVIDSRIGYTGGINITDEENDALRDDAYRDLHLRLTGDVVLELQQVFVEDWIYATGEHDFISEIARSLPALESGPICAQVLTSGPDSDWEAIHRLQVSTIHAARQRVWLVTPYFVPGEAALMALSSAALSGLDVRLMVPKMSDSRWVTLAARSYYDRLLAAGVKIYEYGPRMLHTKALLTDDDVAIIGSANFDNRSFRLNFEVSVLFEDATVTAALARQIETEFAHAPRVRASRPQAFLTERLPEALARLLSPLL